MEIYLDKRLKGLGYNGITMFNTGLNEDEFDLSRGKTNSYSEEMGMHPGYPRMEVKFKTVDVTLIGGADFITAYDNLELGHRTGFLYEMLLSNLDRYKYITILATAYNNGVNSGRSEIQSGIRDLLNI